MDKTREFILLQGIDPSGTEHTALIDLEDYDADNAPLADYFPANYHGVRELGIVVCVGCTDAMDTKYGSD